MCAFKYAGCKMAEADEGTFNAVRSWDVNGSLESSCQGSGKVDKSSLSERCLVIQRYWQ